MGMETITVTTLDEGNRSELQNQLEDVGKWNETASPISENRRSGIIPLPGSPEFNKAGRVAGGFRHERPIIGEQTNGIRKNINEDCRRKYNGEGHIYAPIVVVVFSISTSTG